MKEKGLFGRDSLILLLLMVGLPIGVHLAVTSSPVWWGYVACTAGVVVCRLHSAELERLKPPSVQQGECSCCCGRDSLPESCSMRG